MDECTNFTEGGRIAIISAMLETAAVNNTSDTQADLTQAEFQGTIKTCVTLGKPSNGFQIPPNSNQRSWVTYRHTGQVNLPTKQIADSLPSLHAQFVGIATAEHVHRSMQRLVSQRTFVLRALTVLKTLQPYSSLQWPGRYRVCFSNDDTRASLLEPTQDI